MDRIPATAVEQVMEKLRRDETPYRVAAALVGEVTPPDLDGACWRFVVSDGLTVGTVDAGLSGTKGGMHGMTVDPGVLERAVEKASGGFPVESRLRDLLAASPLVLSDFDG